MTFDAAFWAPLHGKQVKIYIPGNAFWGIVEDDSQSHVTISQTNLSSVDLIHIPQTAIMAVAQDNQ